MLPNTSEDLQSRLEHLLFAIKRVYASTYSQNAKAYASSMHNRTEEEKMAVILQPVVGDPTTPPPRAPTPPPQHHQQHHPLILRLWHASHSLLGRPPPP